jgi:hypothetical protein
LISEIEQLKFNIYNDNFFEPETYKLIKPRLLDFLYTLGFNLTGTRRQAHKAIFVGSESENPLHLTGISWWSDHKEDINNGKVYIANKNNLDVMIPLSLKNADTIQKHYETQFSNRVYNKVKNDIIDEETKQLAITCRKISKVYGLSKHPKSNIACFDIDAHPTSIENTEFFKQQALSTLHILLDELNYKEPLYIEISKNGGFHVYYEFDKPVKPEILKKFVDYIKDKYNSETFTINIDLNWTNKILQLPMSVYYRPIKLLNADTKDISKVKFEFISTPLEAINLVKTNLNKNIVSYDSIKIKFEDIEEEYSGSIFKNTYETPVKFSTKKDLFYGAGTRHETWFTKGAVFFYYKKSNGTLESFTEIVLSYDKGSNDIKNDQAKTILNAFKWVQEHFDMSKLKTQVAQASSDFVSNQPYIEKYGYQNLISAISKVALQKHFSSYSIAWQVKALPLIKDYYTEVIGRMLFEHDTNYTISIHKKVRLTAKFKKELEKCYFFSFDLLAKHLSPKYKNINILKVLRVLNSDNMVISQAHGHLNLPTIKIKKSYKINKNISIDTLYQDLTLKLKKTLEQSKNILLYVKQANDTKNEKCKLLLDFSDIDLNLINFW